MSKFIKDSIYNYIEFSEDDMKLIDTREFKRLKSIKQLGSLNEVFPSACHSRFEHSLGVGYLSEKFINKLFQNSDIRIDESKKKIIRNVKIAGLFHDIGHGPFSHSFDHNVLYKLCPGNIFKDHEVRSLKIFENLCKKMTYKKFTGYDIDFIKNCIDPNINNDIYYNQIVANKVNSIDVDKFDYLMRDPYHIGFNYGFDYNRLCNKVKIINNTIFYHKNVSNDIFDMYYTRYKFHKEIYNHKAVKSIELMISDILLQSNDVFNYPSMLETDEFIDLDDNILTRIKYNSDKSLDKCRILIDKINNRNLYKLIYSSNDKSLDEVRDLILDSNTDIKKDDYHFIKKKFDFCNGSESPSNNIKFYSGINTPVLTSELNLSNIIPNNLMENVISVYKKN